MLRPGPQTNIDTSGYMILNGRTVSPGQARGEARIVDSRSLLETAAETRPLSSQAWEVERLRAAIGRAVMQLDRVNRQLGQRIGADDAAIFRTHAGILRDGSFVDQITTEIRQHGLSAEAAVVRVVQRTHGLLASNPVALVRDKATDVLDIGRRLIRCLQAVSADHADANPDSVIVAREMTPSELVRYAHQGVAAVITETCGPKSHTAILARSLGMPMITAIEDAVERIAEGRTAVRERDPGEAVTAAMTAPRRRPSRPTLRGHPVASRRR